MGSRVKCSVSHIFVIWILYLSPIWIVVPYDFSFFFFFEALWSFYQYWKACIVMIFKFVLKWPDFDLKVLSCLQRSLGFWKFDGILSLLPCFFLSLSLSLSPSPSLRLPLSLYLSVPHSLSIYIYLSISLSPGCL